MSDFIQIEQLFYSLTWRIRQQAMYPEKEIREMELPDDPNGVHFGLYLDHELTGVVSLFAHETTAQFRKMAVLPQQQGKGLGKLLLQYIISYCREQEMKKLWCNARVNALGFYTKLGFKTTDVAYLQNGIEYIKMELIL